MASPQPATIQPASRVRGRVRVPGDKSISHRYALLSALADGESVITGYLQGAACAAPLACLRPAVSPARVVASGPTAASTRPGAARGLGGLTAPEAPLDAANSGTTMRLLA